MTQIAIGADSPTGLRWPHYVNGRLLTAQDLVAEQDAVMRRDRWLGIALGSGIAQGLEVSGSPASSVLQVSPGTGVSPGGTAVHLDAPATLDLSVVSTGALADGSKFADCRPADTNTKAPNAGAYLLAMTPTSSFDGKVPVQGSPNATLPTPCTSRWEIEGVTFSAIRLDGFTTKTTAANRRNLLAHWCFGSAALEDLAMSGFTEPVPYRGIDQLADLTSCDLPLAVFDWDGSALLFVDGWSARRRPVRPSAAVALAEVVGDDRAADGEARFLQFQDQLAGLLATPAAASIQALEVFPLLPPAGLVPIDPLAVVKPLVRVAQKRVKVKPELEDRHVVFQKAFVDQQLHLKQFGIDEQAPGPLGPLSQQLSAMQQDIDALQTQVDGLTAQLGGKGGASSASAAVAGRRLALQVLSILADTAGDGVDPTQFFSGMELRIGVVDHETVDFTIRRSWYDEPVLSGAVTLNVFLVMSADEQSIAPYLLFAKRQRGVRWIDLEGRVLDG